MMFSEQTVDLDVVLNGYFNDLYSDRGSTGYRLLKYFIYTISNPLSILLLTLQMVIRILN